MYAYLLNCGTPIAELVGHETSKGCCSNPTLNTGRQKPPINQVVKWVPGIIVAYLICTYNDSRRCSVPQRVEMVQECTKPLHIKEMNVNKFSVPWIHIVASSGRRFVLSHGTRVDMQIPSSHSEELP